MTDTTDLPAKDAETHRFLDRELAIELIKESNGQNLDENDPILVLATLLEAARKDYQVVSTSTEIALADKVERCALAFHESVRVAITQLTDDTLKSSLKNTLALNAQYVRDLDRVHRKFKRFAWAFLAFTALNLAAVAALYTTLN